MFNLTMTFGPNVYTVWIHNSWWQILLVSTCVGWGDCCTRWVCGVLTSFGMLTCVLCDEGLLPNIMPWFPDWKETRWKHEHCTLLSLCIASHHHQKYVSIMLQSSHYTISILTLQMRWVLPWSLRWSCCCRRRLLHRHPPCLLPYRLPCCRPQNSPPGNHLHCTHILHVSYMVNHWGLADQTYLSL